jgi:hypothetical protein
MKHILLVLTLLSTSAFASRDLETVLECADGTKISVYTHERRILQFDLGSELKKVFFPNKEAMTFFFMSETIPILTLSQVLGLPVAVIGQANEGVFYASQFQGLLAIMPERKEVRVLRQNDALLVYLFDGNLNKDIASYKLLNCR